MRNSSPLLTPSMCTKVAVKHQSPSSRLTLIRDSQNTVVSLRCEYQAGRVTDDYMDAILAGLENAPCFVDDILVAGNTEREQTKTLEEVLHRLDKRSVRLNKAKCQFLKPLSGTHSQIQWNPTYPEQGGSHQEGTASNQYNGTTKFPRCRAMLREVRPKLVHNLVSAVRAPEGWC